MVAVVEIQPLIHLLECFNPRKTRAKIRLLILPLTDGTLSTVVLVFLLEYEIDSLVANILKSFGFWRAFGDVVHERWAVLLNNNKNLFI